MAAPLRLKSERIGKITLAKDLPYAKVLIDTGVYHLDQEYEYGVPENLELKVGEWVSVPFNGRNCQGLVTERSTDSTLPKVQAINRVVKGPIILPHFLNLYQKIAQRWAVPIFDVLRFVVKQKTIENTNTVSKTSESVTRRFWQLPPDKNEIEAVRELALKSAKNGATLVIVPEHRLIEPLIDPKYQVMARGGILSPNTFRNIIILREDSEHHYELKSPGFNTRDVALIRSETLGENLLFVGYTPSLELARLIEIGYVESKLHPKRIRVVAKPALQGELIPSALIPHFRQKLKEGPILVLVPGKGYGQAISCAKCRNLAKCGCGGKLTKLSRNSEPTCTICTKVFLEWRCAFCQNSNAYLIGRGIERISEEFGKSFPNTPIHIATADKEILKPVTRRAIVLATVGSAPAMQYAAVLFLEGLSLGSDMRSEERYLSILMRYSAYASGFVLAVERAEHPAINALIKWNPNSYLSRIILDLEDSLLPPSSRHIQLKCEESEAGKIFQGLLVAQRETRIDPEARIYQLEGGVISIFIPLKSAKNAIEFLYQFQRRRSISGKNPLSLRVDPYRIGI